MRQRAVAHYVVVDDEGQAWVRVYWETRDFPWFPTNDEMRVRVAVFEKAPLFLVTVVACMVEAFDDDDIKPITL